MSTTKIPGHSVTITDIAKAAGVSKSTVSLVLKNSPLIKPDTAAKVWKASQELGYVYNRSAANLRQKSSNVVGVIVNDLTNPFFVELLVGAERVLLQSGYITLMAHTAENLETQEKVLASMREQNAAGIILCPAFDTPDDLPQRIAGWGLPLVVMVRPLGETEYDFVGNDNVSGMRMATQHLIDLGHRRIGFLGRLAGSKVSEQRKQGFLDAMQANGLEVVPQWIVDTSVSRQGAQQAAGQLLDQAERPTALVCYNDLVAIGVLNELDRRGLRAGRDLAVIGFDDIAAAAHTSPPLSTCAVGTERLGEIASQTLLQRLRNPDAPATRHHTEPRLVVRESSGPALAAATVG
jgi:LacI family transcriptional regulator